MVGGVELVAWWLVVGGVVGVVWYLVCLWLWLLVASRWSL